MYKEGDEVYIRFENTDKPNQYADFIRSAFMNVLISAAEVTSYSRGYSIKVKLQAPGIDRIDGLIASWGGKVIREQ